MKALKGKIKGWRKNSQGKEEIRKKNTKGKRMEKTYKEKRKL